MYSYDTTIKPLYSCLVLPRIVRVSPKAFAVSPLYLFIFSLLCHSSQYFLVSALLRESIARFPFAPSELRSLEPPDNSSVATSICPLTFLFPTFSSFVPPLHRLSVPVFRHLSVCLFSRLSEYRRFVSLTF